MMGTLGSCRNLSLGVCTQASGQRINIFLSIKSQISSTSKNYSSSWEQAKGQTSLQVEVLLQLGKGHGV